MLLNMLLTRNCNYDCGFCIEKTEDDTKDASDLETFLKKANFLADSGLIDDILLLGGEPLYYPEIVELIEGLRVDPIITTNGHRLADKDFSQRLPYERIRAMNISVPHYDWEKRKDITRRRGLSNEELKEAVSNVQVPIRMNVALMRDYIGSEEEVYRMADFAKSIGINSVKFGELTGVNPSTHDFVDCAVLQYNQAQYCPVPVREIREVCHSIGGTHPYKTVDGVEILFNSAPDFALAGGKDKEGKFYHSVLFNDGMLGFSWRRQDGLYKDENQFLQVARQNQRETR